MGLYSRIALALLLIYQFGDNVLGAPDRGRYQWVRCTPDGQNANCVEERGPLVDITGLSPRLPRSAIKDIVQVKSSKETAEAEEQSGEGSGDLGLIALSPASSERWMNDGLIEGLPQTEQQSLEVDGSGEIDANYEFPERVKPQLSEDDLQQESMLQ
ncbi:serglycin [Brachyhypopomus gauderio]|uniref:serglycin n=1 Tax=Brachyhypopomus gauderio TaxID=698409 RepID=UPI0040428C9E